MFTAALLAVHFAVTQVTDPATLRDYAHRLDPDGPEAAKASARALNRGGHRRTPASKSPNLVQRNKPDQGKKTDSTPYLLNPNVPEAAKASARALNRGGYRGKPASMSSNLVQPNKQDQGKKSDPTPALKPAATVPTLPTPTDGYYYMMTAPRLSPALSSATPIDTVRTFSGADGRPITVVILKPRGSGVYTGVPNAGETGNQFLSRVVNAAKAAGAQTLAIKPGRYRFDGGWGLSNTSDLVIDGQGSLFELAGTGSFSFNGCNRIVLRNLYIRWHGTRLSSLGTVIGDSRIQLNSPPGVTLGCLAFAEYDAVNMTWPLDRQLHETFGGGITFQPNGLSNSSSALDSYIGKTVVVRHAEGSPLIVSAKSNDMTFESIRFGSGPHFVFKLQQGRGFHVANCVVKRDLDALSTNWDGVHIPGSGGDIIIENNEIAHNGDDSINIHGVYLTVSAPGGNTVTHTGEGWRLSEDMDVSHHALAYDSQLNYLGSFLVTGKSGSTITFSTSVPSSTHWLLSYERIPRRIIINGNWSHDHRARGLLLQACNALVTNNHFERMTHSGMQLTLAPGTYGEGPGPFNVVVQGNSFNTLGASSNGFYNGILNAATDKTGFTLATGLKTIRMIQIIGNTFSDLRNGGAVGVYVDSTVGEQVVQ